MNKRGFLLGEETLKIVIAVICIGFLVYFLFSIYYNSKDKNFELAEASVQKIVDEADSGGIEVIIYNPEEWYILNYQNSLCICKEPDKCDSGACEQSDLIVEGFIQIKNPPITLQVNNKKITK